MLANDIPSFAALKKSKEVELRRPLTDAETKNLYQNATAVEVPKKVHQAGPTYGGKNTPSRVIQDIINLCGAECRDTEASPIPQSVLDSAKKSNVIIRDTNGKIYK